MGRTYNIPYDIEIRHDTDEENLEGKSELMPRMTKKLHYRVAESYTPLNEPECNN